MTRTNLSMSISADGYVAGPDQSEEHPLGVGGIDVHRWHIGPGSDHPVNQQVMSEMLDGMGATIMGRNMFGPIRGDWADSDWRGWWGDNPPYHVPTFILTHHARAPIQMEGGTTFHFVTGGIREALERAREAANGKDVRIGGGASTIQQYLRAGLIDELHFAISPVLLGRGERLFEGIDARALGYECVQFVASERATHVVLRRQAHNDA